MISSSYNRKKVVTHHPHRGRSYWYKNTSGLGKEYVIGIATHANHARQYASQGYERIDRERARRELSSRGDAATQVNCTVLIDGEPATLTRFELARGMKTGRLPTRTSDDTRQVACREVSLPDQKAGLTRRVAGNGAAQD
jgi:hypothetical protein